MEALSEQLQLSFRRYNSEHEGLWLCDEVTCVHVVSLGFLIFTPTDSNIVHSESLLSLHLILDI